MATSVIKNSTNVIEAPTLILPSKYGKFEKTIRLYKVNYEIPDPPNLKDIEGYNRPETEQKWKPTPLPNCWHPAYLKVIGDQKYKKDQYWWTNEDNTTPEMKRFHAQEWNRRTNGYWLYIRGVPTWITGIHYMYCNYYYIESRLADYRDRDRRFWYMWDYVEKDPMAYGMIYVKHRRDGASHRGGHINVEFGTRTRNANCGWQSKTGADAKVAFKVKIYNPFKKLPPFFKPPAMESDDKIEFRNPVKRHNEIYTDDEIQTVLDWRNTVFNAYDSQKVHRITFDEGSKVDVKCDLYDAWTTIKECLSDGPRKYKIFMPSTIELVKENPKAFDAFKSIWQDSDPEHRNEFGMTISGLLQYYVPCYDGYKEDFFDEWGASVIDDPTPEELKRLIKLHPTSSDIKFGLGAKNFEQRNFRDPLIKQGKRNQLIRRMRLYPFSVEEAFYQSSGQSFWDAITVQETKDQLESRSGPSGTPMYNEIIQYGNFEFIEDDWGFSNNKWKGTVKFVPCHKDDARFWIRRDYGFAGKEKCGLRFNAVKSREGHLYPDQEHAFIIGTDPIEFDKEHVSSAELSKAGAYGFRKFQAAVDGDKEDRNEWASHCFVFEYFARPELTEVYYQDMLMACIFFGTKVHAERQKMEGMTKYFQRQGCMAFIKFRPSSLMSTTETTSKAAPGTPASAIIHNEGFNKIGQFVKDHMTPNSFPFIRGCEQLLTFDYSKITKFDLIVAIIFTIVLDKDTMKENETEQKHKSMTSAIPRYRIEGNKSVRIR